MRERQLVLPSQMLVSRPLAYKAFITHTYPSTGTLTLICKNRGRSNALTQISGGRTIRIDLCAFTIRGRGDCLMHSVSATPTPTPSSGKKCIADALLKFLDTTSKGLPRCHSSVFLGLPPREMTAFRRSARGWAIQNIMFENELEWAGRFRVQRCIGY